MKTDCCDAVFAALRASRGLAIFVVSFCSLLVTVARPAVAATPGTWRSAGTMSVGRENNHVLIALLDGRALVAGGNERSADLRVLANADLFDPVTEQWSPAPSMSTPRQGAAGTLLADGRVLVAGGALSNAGTGFLASAETFDPTTDSWSPAASMNEPRVTGTATLLVNGKVLVTGGLVPSPSPFVIARSAELYDPQRNEWTTIPPLSTPRASHTATLLKDGRVLVVGGQTDGSSGVTGTAEIYDPTSNSWSSAGSLLGARFGHGAALLHDGRLLVAGGGAIGTEIYDPARNTWSQAAPMSIERGFVSAVTLANGEALVAGGNRAPFGETATAETYDPETDTWSPAGAMTEPRFNYAATLLANGSVLVVGGCCGSTPQLTADIFTPSLACPPEVTNQVDVLRFRVHRIPFTPFRFQWVLVRNKTADPIPGPLAFVMDDLQRALFIGSSLRTTCFSETGDPFVVIHAGSDDVLSPDEFALALLFFFKTEPGPITYTARVLSGAPTQ